MTDTGWGNQTGKHWAILALVIGERELPPYLEEVADEIVRLPEGIGIGGSDDG